MRAFVTGIGGFAGRHLIRHLQACGDSVAGLARSADADGLPDNVDLFLGDLTDQASVLDAVRGASPDAVYHLAAQSSSTESLADPWETLQNNLRGQVYLLDALVRVCPSVRVLVIGSAEEYGGVAPQHLPTTEEAPLRPVTPYAVSKVGQDMMGFQYFAQFKLPVVRVRPFSHTGPGHDPRFAVPAFARQIAEIEAGLRDPVLRVGNLEAKRDFCDVRDMVRAYRMAALVGEPGEVYNLGSGRSISVQSVLDDLVRTCRVPVVVETDPERLRPVDIPIQQADITKFQRIAAWVPRVPWQQTLADTLEYWRERVASPVRS